MMSKIFWANVIFWNSIDEAFLKAFKEYNDSLSRSFNYEPSIKRKSDD